MIENIKDNMADKRSLVLQNQPFYKRNTGHFIALAISIPMRLNFVVMKMREYNCKFWLKPCHPSRDFFLCFLHGLQCFDATGVSISVAGLYFEMLVLAVVLFQLINNTSSARKRSRNSQKIEFLAALAFWYIIPLIL